MSSPGKFLCGCDPKDPHVKNYSMDLVVVGTEKVLSNKRWKDGKEVCPIHGKPLYGSASITKRGPQGNQIIDHYAEFQAVYGRGKDAPIVSSVEDRRDNRDPEEVGLAYLSRKTTEWFEGKP